MTTVRWGLLSTASIGGLVVRATRQSRATRFVAVASRDGNRARQFAAAFGLDQAFASYEALLESDIVDAVYVGLPNSMHAEWTIKALRAGKHVLCEKPFVLSPADAAAAFDAAAGARRVCAEGFMYRYHPSTLLAQQLVGQGRIGTLSHIRSALSGTMPAGDIRRDRALGGGAYLDLGSYCVSAARLFAGNPQRVYGEAVFDANGVDLRLAATMRLGHDVLAQFDVGMELPRRDELELIGSDGTIVISDPWLCRAETIELRRDGRSEHLPVDPGGSYALAHDDHDVYRIELDAISTAITDGTELPYGRQDAIDQARVLQALIRSAEIAAPVPLSLPSGRVAVGRTQRTRRTRRAAHHQGRGQHDLTRRGPAALQPLDRQRDRLPGLLARILADGGQIDVGQPRQQAVVVSHHGKDIGNLHAPPQSGVEEPDGAAVVGRYHRGGQVRAGQQHRGGANARVLGMVAGDDP